MALVAPQVSSSREPQASSQGHLQQQEDARSDSIESSFTGGKDAPAPEVDLLSVSFNQDSSCFACATNSGFRIFCCDPLKETIRREFNGGGIGLVEMLFRCNFLALVGGGENPRYPPNKVMIWDDNQSRCIGELTFRSEVRAVRLRRDRIVVVLEHKVYVYNFEDLKLLHTVETLANTKGLCVISQATNNAVMACPGIHKGQVRVDLFDSKRTRFITAHDSALACLALTLDGKRLATASVKGTLLRIWNTADGTKLQEVRRGADRAEIYSIAFSSAAHFLALCSDKGTVHVFALKPSCVVDADPMDYASLDGKKRWQLKFKLFFVIYERRFAQVFQLRVVVCPKPPARGNKGYCGFWSSEAYPCGGCCRRKILHDAVRSNQDWRNGTNQVYEVLRRRLG